MELTGLPLPPEIWAATPCAAQALIVALQARIRELEAQLGQTSANSSRPPSSDPPQVPPRPKAPPSGRKRGGQPGHRGTFRGLLPVAQVAVVNMDETGWRQEQRRAWLWTVVTAELTVFQIDCSRGGMVVDALLGADFAGIVGSDRWSAYSRFPAERRALCYAHLKRDFQGLVDRGGEAEPIGRWGLDEIDRLFALWHGFRARA